ncbi:MAG: UDP-glucose 6-dehydrogenase, partial [uncultured Chloroflexia bacterium]
GRQPGVPAGRLSGARHAGARQDRVGCSRSKRCGGRGGSLPRDGCA